MDFGLDRSHPLSLKADKQVYADPDGGRAVSVLRLPDARAAEKLLRRREEMLAELGDCPWLNLPRAGRVVEAEGGVALIEEMLLARADGPAETRARELLEGVRALHERGWVHMDLKPEHLLWAEGRWRLHDFDGAMRAGERFRRRDITFLYAPPDVRWHDCADISDDLYAAALMLYREKSGGRLPLERGSERLSALLRRAMPAVPVPRQWGSEARSFFRRALCPLRRGRFHSTQEFIDAWRRLETA